MELFKPVAFDIKVHSCNLYNLHDLGHKSGWFFFQTHDQQQFFFIIFIYFFLADLFSGLAHKQQLPSFPKI